MNAAYSETEPPGSVQKTEEAKDRTGFILEALKLVFLLLLVSVVTLSAIKYLWQTISIEGDSMVPTFKDTDNILISKIGKKDNFSRYDIIVFKPYNEDNSYTEEDERDVLFIKRIIGLPGETINISRDGKISVTDKNGNTKILSDDPFQTENYSRGINWNLSDDNYYETVKLSDEEYFVLGDNRSVSLDSRSTQIRGVNMNCIVGKYLIGISPFGKK